MDEQDPLPVLQERSPREASAPAPAATQFGLRAMFLTMTGFGVLFGICTALGLPPNHLLAAFLISALTAVGSIAVLQLSGRIGTRQGPRQTWGRCLACRKTGYVYANGRCHACCLKAMESR